MKKYKCTITIWKVFKIIKEIQNGFEIPFQSSQNDND